MKWCIFLIAILSISLVSANVLCLDGSKTIISSKTVSVHSIERLNDLNVGLVSLSGSSSYGRILAEILINGKRLTLNNPGDSKIIEYSSKDYKIEIVNFTNEEANLKVKGEKVTIKEGEVKEIKRIYIYLKDIKKSDNLIERSGNFIIGTNFLQLNFPKNKYKIIEENNKSYIIEITSAQSDTALLRSYSCKSKIKYIDDELKKTSEEDTPKVKDNTQEINKIQDRKDLQYVIGISLSLILLIVLIVIINKSKRK